jgi:hypothetical protein
MFGASARTRRAAQNVTYLLLSKSEGRSGVPRKVFDSIFPVVFISSWSKARLSWILRVKLPDTFDCDNFALP